MKHTLILFIIGLIINLFDCDFSFDKRKQIKKEDANYNETSKLFLKFEDEISKHRDSIRVNRIFITPDDEAYDFGKILTQAAPSLLKKTQEHKVSLLKILESKSINKNNSFNEDIVCILYGLCVEEYADVLTKLYELYRFRKIDFNTMRIAIDQQSHLSNMLILNYNELSLKVVLEKIEADTKKINSSESIVLREIVNSILSGIEYNSAKESNNIQPPVFAYKNCH
jgi:hypothetical protein